MERLTLPINEKPYMVYGLPVHINRYWKNIYWFKSEERSKVVFYQMSLLAMHQGAL